MLRVLNPQVRNFSQTNYKKNCKNTQVRHSTQNGYPLRPELMESTYLLHCLTGAACLDLGVEIFSGRRGEGRAVCVCTACR